MDKLIQTDYEYEMALNRIDEIFDASPNTKEFDELELLVKLVEFYENEKYAIETPDPITAIKFRMEQQGLKQYDLVPFIGSKSKVSEVLSGKKNLSLNMIRKLHEGLDIPLEILIQPNQMIRENENIIRNKRIREKTDKTCYTCSKITVQQQL